MRKQAVLLSILALLAVLAGGCGSGAKGALEVLQPGDLLFQSTGSSAMSKAIASSTAADSVGYDHVGIFAVVDGAPMVIESTPRGGVVVTSAEQFLQAGTVTAMRLTGADIDLDAAIERAKGYVGTPYDSAYLPGDDKLYCSELVQVCYLDDSGAPVFPSTKMTFRDIGGEIPDYWVRHFNELGISIPEGAPGTNPNQLFASPLLQKAGCWEPAGR